MTAASDFTAEGLARIDDIVASAVDQKQAPGIAAAVARGGQTHVTVAGRMALDGAPMQRDSLFRIASITKPMTATVILSLVEDGHLRLDEPVDGWLPELADRRVLRNPDGPLTDTVPAERPVTVRDLLTFTWGFGMQGAMFMAPEPWPIFTAAMERHLHTFGEPRPDDTPDPDTWMARLSELPLLAQPGQMWLYQTGSQVLGVLAARVAGVPFDQVLHERLFDRLGMRDTAFHAVDPGRLVTAYANRDGELAVSDPPTGRWAQPPKFQDGSGGLVSSVDDIVAFGRMLLDGGGPVLQASTVAEMTRDQLTPAQQTRYWTGFDILRDRSWGYGVSVTQDGRYTWDGGLGTAWSNVPSQDLTVVVLTQRAWDEAGPPAVCEDVVAAARQSAV